MGNAKTLRVAFFDNYAELVNPTMAQDVTDKIRDIMLQRTPLSLISGPADVEFEGAITRYSISPISAQGGNTAAQNRMTIEVNVIFTNNVTEKDSYEQRFSRYRDYAATLPLAQAEATLIPEICEEIAEDVFNKAFVNW